jgi:hypothetical protein
MRRRWWRAGRRLISGHTRGLDHGLLRLSHTDLNITDVASFRDHLMALHGVKRRAGHPVPIALTLPDLCGRFAIFEFDALPAKSAECEALLRWRFQKDLNMSAATARIAYRAFPCGTPATQTSAACWRVLAGAVKTDIIEQYEHVCEEAGFIPISIGLASTRILDLYREMMTRLNRDLDEYFFVNVSESALSFFVFRAGIPVFLRIKALRNGIGADASMVIEYCANELRASVHFYDDSMRNVETRASYAGERILFIFNSTEWSSSKPSSGLECGVLEAVSGRGVPYAHVLAERLASTLQVKVIPLLWESLATWPARRLCADSTFTPHASVTALAGIMRT